MTDAVVSASAQSRDSTDESLYLQFHESFITEPVEMLELDRSKNRLLALHPHHGFVSNFAIRADNFKVDRSVQAWLLTATSLAVNDEFVVFLTNPYGKLVKANRRGQVLDQYEIWHRYLTSLVLTGNYIFVTDRRNDVIIQFDMSKPMSEESSLLIGRGFLHRPLSASVLMSTFLVAVQNDGRVIVFHLETGFRLTSFAEDIPMIGEVTIQAEDTHKTVLLSKEMEKSLDVYCFCGYRRRLQHGQKVPRFCLALRLGLSFSPYCSVYSPEMQIIYLLERREKVKSQVHAFRLNLQPLNHI
uniref:Vps16_N domain-containing protein n=1 Tax=Macrostomum lignano TaxID=282301 RepID=A0A1I8G088_9PLAT